MLVSVLAHAGLRPGEALALTWSHIRERTILVERAVALGELKTTKTSRMRTVRLLAPLAADLREWRIGLGSPAGEALVFPGRANGGSALAAGGPATSGAVTMGNFATVNQSSSQSMPSPAQLNDWQKWL